jgi:predicted ATP-grasp superfamily ATP-dependent carboligase
MFDGVSIIVPDADGGIPLRVIRCLGPEGAEFTLITKDGKNSALKSKYCQSSILAKSDSDAGRIDTLMQIEKSAPREVILPITTDGFQFVSRNRERLSERFLVPPISAIEQLALASDKLRLAELSVANGIPVLPSRPLTAAGVRAIERGELDVSFPLLVKAKSREHGAGARRVETASELSNYYSELEGERSIDYFFQPYIDGDDFSLAAFCEGGEIRNHTLWKGEIAGKEFTPPTCVRFVEDDHILNLARRLMRVLKWDGVCDIDFFVEKKTGEVWLLEVNARFWGNVFACLRGGVNFPLLMCQAALQPGERYTCQQIDGSVFCHPKGISRLLNNSKVRSDIAKHPLRMTGLESSIHDPLPDLYRLYLKLIRALTKGD